MDNKTYWLSLLWASLLWIFAGYTVTILGFAYKNILCEASGVALIAFAIGVMVGFWILSGEIRE